MLTALMLTTHRLQNLQITISLTHIGVKYMESSSKNGRKWVLKVLTRVPRQSLTCIITSSYYFQKVMSHLILRPNRMLIVCVPRNQVYTHTVQKMGTELPMSQYNIFFTRIMSYKRLIEHSQEYSSGRLHNSTDNRPGVIACLKHLIKESKISFNFWAAGLSSMRKIARLSTLMVGTQQVVGKIWYAWHNIKDKAITKLYAEKQLHIDSLILSILFTMWYQPYDKVNHLAKTISYFTFSSIGYTTQITVAHCNLPTRHNQSKLYQNPLIMWGLQTSHNCEHDYHDSLHSVEVYTLYPRVVIPSPFDD
jgi:hypothetical protein